MERELGGSLRLGGFFPTDVKKSAQAAKSVKFAF